MWFLHIKNNTKWYITDEEHQRRLLKNSEYKLIDVAIENVEKPNPKLNLDTLNFKELQALAKEKGLKTFGIKKEDLIKSLKDGE